MKQDEYVDRVTRLENANPAEPLLPALRRGFLPINRLYLKLAEARAPTEIVGEEESFGPLPNADETLRGLWGERGRLFGLMNKQSNVFHQCETDAQRRENSQKVLAFWNGILQVKAKIAHCEQHGEMPGECAADDLPDNPVQLGLKLNSFKVQLSKARGLVRHLAEKGAPGANIDEAEAKVRRWAHLKGLAEEKLKTYGTEEN